jgi:hypothetical protein
MLLWGISVSGQLWQDCYSTYMYSGAKSSRKTGGVPKGRDFDNPRRQPGENGYQIAQPQRGARIVPRPYTRLIV